MQTSASPAMPNRRYALVLLGMQYFLAGLITVSNDVLNPFFKQVFGLSFLAATAVQLCFFGAYLIFSLLASRLLALLGYQNTLMVACLVLAFGCGLFLPAAQLGRFPSFLGALLVLGTGLTVFQVAANPYGAFLGSAASAGSRMSVLQAFYSLGTLVGPPLATRMLMDRGAYDVNHLLLPYGILAVLLLGMAVLTKVKPLPDALHSNKRLPPTNASQRWQIGLGAAAIFCYVGAEISIGSSLLSIISQSGLGISAGQAGVWISAYWSGSLVGRLAGGLIFSRLSPARVLLAASGACACLLLLGMQWAGLPGILALLALGIFNSVQFPAIFSLTLAGLGLQANRASGFLVMAISGGAVLPLVHGGLADLLGGLRPALVVPLAAYGLILTFALFRLRR